LWSCGIHVNLCNRPWRVAMTAECPHGSGVGGHLPLPPGGVSLHFMAIYLNSVRVKLSTKKPHAWWSLVCGIHVNFWNRPWRVAMTDLVLTWTVVQRQ